MGNSPEIDHIPVKTFYFVAQMAHWLCGCLAVVWPVLIFGAWIKWYAAGFIVTYAAIKEFFYDENYESKIERGSNLEDFSFYTLGATLAVVSMWLKGI